MQHLPVSIVYMKMRDLNAHLTLSKKQGRFKCPTDNPAMVDWSPFDKLSQQQYDNLNGSIVSSVFQTGQSVAKGRRLRLLMMHSKNTKTNDDIDNKLQH